MNPSPWIVVALGSNLGDSARLVRGAMADLAQLSRTPLQRSSLWRSAPVDCPPGSPWFVNAVARLVPLETFTPLNFLDQLQALEHAAGRRRQGARNQARPLDLDLVLWGDLQMRDPRLILPHPRAARRAFVLEPLAEIAPDLVWPGTAKRVGELLGQLEDRAGLERMGPA